MMGFIKKGVFVLSGILLIGSGFVVGKTGKVTTGANNETKKKVESEVKQFGDWFLSCIDNSNGKGAKKSEVCLLTQQVIDKSNEKEPKVMATYHVRYMENGKGKKRELGMVEVLPADAHIASGTSIIADKKLIAVGKYITCVGGSCTAVARLNDGDLKAFLSSSNSSVSMIDHNGQQVNLFISKEGLREGIKALEKRNKK